MDAFPIVGDPPFDQPYELQWFTVWDLTRISRVLEITKLGTTYPPSRKSCPDPILLPSLKDSQELNDFAEQCNEWNWDAKVKIFQDRPDWVFMVRYESEEDLQWARYWALRARGKLLDSFTQHAGDLKSKCESIGADFSIFNRYLSNPYLATLEIESQIGAFLKTYKWIPMFTAKGWQLPSENITTDRGGKSTNVLFKISEIWTWSEDRVKKSLVRDKLQLHISRSSAYALLRGCEDPTDVRVVIKYKVVDHLRKYLAGFSSESSNSSKSSRGTNPGRNRL